MKHNFKKIVSLVLTVVMLLGTMSVLIPTAVSAETADPIYLEKNKTTTINGITYRFDVPESHTSSWARVNADGTWEFHITNGDMLWFPDVEMTDSSANFIFAKHPYLDGKKLYLELKERGILVRHFDLPKISMYNRITVGLPEQMQVLIETVREILEEN